MPVSRGGEDDLASIGRPGWLLIVPRIGGELDQPCAIRIDQEQIETAPQPTGEHNPVPAR